MRFGNRVEFAFLDHFHGHISLRENVSSWFNDGKMTFADGRSWWERRCFVAEKSSSRLIYLVRRDHWLNCMNQSAAVCCSCSFDLRPTCSSLEIFFFLHSSLSAGLRQRGLVRKIEGRMTIAMIGCSFENVGRDRSIFVLLIRITGCTQDNQQQKATNNKQIPVWDLDFLFLIFFLLLLLWTCMPACTCTTPWWGDGGHWLNQTDDIHGLRRLKAKFTRMFEHFLAAAQRPWQTS